MKEERQIREIQLSQDFIAGLSLCWALPPNRTSIDSKKSVRSYLSSSRNTRFEQDSHRV